MKILNCSSKGDKRFSAFYAKVEVNGVCDSIENHYQMAKRFGLETPKNWRQAKGRKPTHFELSGKCYPLELLSQYYALLWVKYLDGLFKDNPQLLTELKSYDSFYDPFAKPGCNNQAEVIEMYVKKGRATVMDFCSQLTEEIKNK